MKLEGKFAMTVVTPGPVALLYEAKIGTKRKGKYVGYSGVGKRNEDLLKLTKFSRSSVALLAHAAAYAATLRSATEISPVAATSYRHDK